MADAELLRAGVIGAGVFGAHHARKYEREADVDLRSIYDPVRTRVEALAAETGAEPTVSLDAFLNWVDVVTVASPAVTHADMARAALARGKHVYVEKPLATSLEEADALVAAAAENNLILACGHQERAVFQAMGLLDVSERPLRIEAVRRGVRSGRNEDVSCVLDLMVHDLDLALTLAGGEPIAVEAEGDEDAVQADVTFADGMSAVFDASRAADARERRMLVVFPSGELEIDFLQRTFRNTTAFELNADFAETPAGRDPLGASVDQFLAAVRGRAPRPLVTGEEARAALDLALAVEQAAGI